MEADKNVGVPLFYDKYGISVLAIYLRILLNMDNT